jgi:AcrR family transcriptional regulator
MLETARRLFSESGYVATLVSDIAEEAGVVVQTIYARLGSKNGLLMGLLDLIDEDANVSDGAAAVAAESVPEDVLGADGQLARRCRSAAGTSSVHCSPPQPANASSNERSQKDSGAILKPHRYRRLAATRRSWTFIRGPSSRPVRPLSSSIDSLRRVWQVAQVGAARRRSSEMELEGESRTIRRGARPTPLSSF